MRNDELMHLSLVAHEQALERVAPIPAERPEFGSLPMKRVGGAPVFDGARMRPDQVADTIDALERLTGRAARGSVLTQITDYMYAYGRFGVRVKDLTEVLGMSKPAALKALRKLNEAGKVTILEEKNPRAGATPRKRYVWTENEIGYRELEVALQYAGLYVATDTAGDGDSGIRHHGTAVQGVTCGCVACREAFEDGLIAEYRSRERVLGGTGFFSGLELRRMRRERELTRDRAVVRVA